MGMSDMQFKCYIRKLLRMVKDVKKQEEKEDILKLVDVLEQELEEDLKG